MSEEGAPKDEKYEPKIKPRPYAQELKFLERLDKTSWRISKGMVPGMHVPGIFYVNDHLETLMLEELKYHCDGGGVGGFLPAVKQIANVASLPGIVHASVGLPDVHSGYGFAIGNVAACTYSVISFVSFFAAADRPPPCCSVLFCCVVLCCVVLCYVVGW